jgi:hypothetical protein
MKPGTFQPLKGCERASTLKERAQNGGKQLAKIRHIEQQIPKQNIGLWGVRWRKSHYCLPECRFSQTFFSCILLTDLLKVP